MDFKKKMKMRLHIAVSYCILGTILIVAAAAGRFENHFISAFGFALLFIGILRIVQNRKITKSEHNMQRREVIETDERNIMLSERARSWTFSFITTAAGILVIILSVLGYHDQALPFAWFVCTMVALYLVFYLIASRKY